LSHRKIEKASIRNTLKSQEAMIAWLS